MAFTKTQALQELYFQRVKFYIQDTRLGNLIPLQRFSQCILRRHLTGLGGRGQGGVGVGIASVGCAS